MKTDLDLYTDYLLNGLPRGSFGQTSATGLSRLLNNSISHDDVTDFLNQTELLLKHCGNKQSHLSNK